MAKKRQQLSKAPGASHGISSIAVEGYKSISSHQRIDVRALTLLAGANSSGKSSMMQPLLLIKQTLDASYDPGALLLNGPNVKYTSADQVLSKGGEGPQRNSFSLEIAVGTYTARMVYARHPSRGFDIVEMQVTGEDEDLLLRPNMPAKELLPHLPDFFQTFSKKLPAGKKAPRWQVERVRSFLNIKLGGVTPAAELAFGFAPAGIIEAGIHNIIHLPGLRGNPEREYPVTAVGPTFPGTFEAYAASIIAQWQDEGNSENLKILGADLEHLGLTWKVIAKRIADTQVELRVGRLQHARRGGARDLVNIADVGFGVSQTLPVIVGLILAQPGQLVLVEQPETHLHPRAQVKFADIVARAAARGVRVVIETHSSLLLLAVQAAVAEGRLAPNLTALHWFRRNESGMTEVQSAQLDESGRFGDWPEDFADVSLEAEQRFLDAVESRFLTN